MRRRSGTGLRESLLTSICIHAALLAAIVMLRPTVAPRLSVRGGRGAEAGGISFDAAAGPAAVGGADSLTDAPPLLTAEPLMLLTGADDAGDAMDVANSSADSALGDGAVALPQQALFAPVEAGRVRLGAFDRQSIGEVLHAPAMPVASGFEGAGGDGVAEGMPAAMRGNLPPIYPPESRRLGEEGTVRLRVSINRDGTVGGLEVIQSSGHARLDKAAADAVATWRFEPAVKRGRPVECDVELPVAFVLRRR